MKKIGFGVAVAILLGCNISSHGATLTPEVPATPSQTTLSQQALAAKDWAARCVSDSRQAPPECSMDQSLVLANSGQLVASVVVRTQPAAQLPIIGVRVPAGLFLPAGLNIQLDDDKPQPIPLQTCDLQGCYAEMQMNANLLAGFKKSKQLAITFQNMSRKDVTLSLPLNDFDAVFKKIEQPTAGKS